MSTPYDDPWREAKFAVRWTTIGGLATVAAAMIVAILCGWI